MARLAGKVALVTGGARGIGRHYSLALAAEGARVMIADIEDGSALAAEIAARHGANSAASATFDVSDEKAVEALVAETLARFGQIDVLVNNAALYAKLSPRNFNMLPYVTSKGAMLAFTRALSRELGAYGIAVNTLAPGYILSETGLENASHVEEARVPVRNTRAFKRDAYPEDLTGTLVFLASSDSDFITGQSIVVDGGSVNN
jgi:NAD(P)-dependent dehydrogenase (short-subunit alcohol dehydrogenase family)